MILTDHVELTIDQILLGMEVLITFMPVPELFHKLSMKTKLNKLVPAFKLTSLVQFARLQDKLTQLIDTLQTQE